MPGYRNLKLMILEAPEMSGLNTLFLEYVSGVGDLRRAVTAKSKAGGHSPLQAFSEGLSAEIGRHNTTLQSVITAVYVLGDGRLIDEVTGIVRRAVEDMKREAGK